MTDIQNAVRILKDGGIVIYPTDTAFGIGCRIDKPESVERLFRIRRRPLTQAMPVLVASREMALAYLQSPGDIVRRLMKTYWPGPLTIVAFCHTDRIVSPIRGGGRTVGLRMPNHKTALGIIAGAGVPILGPSANVHGKKTPFVESDLDPDLIRQVDYVVSGICTLMKPSTVVDTTTQPATILRDGALLLSKEDLR